jgi:hypothetical protein
MNMVLKQWENQMQKNAHSMYQNIIHNETFWAAAVMALILTSMILLAVFAPNTGVPANFQTPFGYFPYY